VLQPKPVTMHIDARMKQLSSPMGRLPGASTDCLLMNPPRSPMGYPLLGRRYLSSTLSAQGLYVTLVECSKLDTTEVDVVKIVAQINPRISGKPSCRSRPEVPTYL